MIEPVGTRAYDTSNLEPSLTPAKTQSAKRDDQVGRYKRSKLADRLRAAEPAVAYKVYTTTYADKPLREFHTITPQTPLASLNLNWREADLPERERTKHVHRLHPYLGKFIPQIAEIFLRKFAPKSVSDPFCGSGTTLVEANVLGIASVGCDVSQFNCLMAKVKTDRYDIALLEKELRDIIAKTNLMVGEGLFANGKAFETDNEYLKQWFAPTALRQLLCFRSLIHHYTYADVMKIILSRSARSSRLTKHFDLDFPKTPQREPYFCHKHEQICQPTDNALQFLNRYTYDTLDRIEAFARIRTGASVKIMNQDARHAAFPKVDAILTSPPYVGLIDYHEQHRYAYELLGLKTKEHLEIGAAFKGSSEEARKRYIDQIGQVFANLRPRLADDGVAIIVVNDKFGLYEELASQIGYRLDETVTRHVNRRTGRRTTDFFEEVLIWKKHD